MTEPDPDPGADAQPRLAGAAARLIDEYQAHSNWMTELEAELKTARAQRRELNTAIASTLRLLENPMRKAMEAEVARIERAAAGLAPPRVMPGPFRLLLEILRDWPDPEILVHEVSQAMRRHGATLAPRYAANTLRRLVKEGGVSRAAHGLYRINRVIIEQRLAGAR